MELTLHMDGGSRGNPGPAAAGVVILAQDGRTMLEAGYFLGTATNNVAEYEGLVRALRYAAENGATRVKIVSDSQLLVRQLKGEYRVRSAVLQPLFDEAKRLLAGFERWHATHVSRDQNTRADRLVNQALDARRDVVLGGSASASMPAAANANAASVSAHWAVRFTRQPPKTCPMSGAHGSVFRFGPDTPAGVCVFAAQAVLDSGVLGGDLAARQIRCPRCGAQIQIAPCQE